MSEELKIKKKELAKLKRKATEVASEIHDIVEDTLWSDYTKLPELSEKLVESVQRANEFKAQNNL